MTKPETTGETSPRASHEAYIRAVVAELAKRGVQATDLRIQASAPRRAMMTVAMETAEDDQEGADQLAPRSTTWDSAEWVRLRWDENDGWAWQVRYHGDEQPRGAIYFGVSAVPPPNAVADWMHIGLIHPEITPSREDGPFTTPDLDAVLRTYTATTG